MLGLLGGDFLTHTNSTGRRMHIEKSGLVICNEEDADGRPRVSTAGSTC